MDEMDEKNQKPTILKLFFYFCRCLKHIVVGMRQKDPIEESRRYVENAAL